jgi:AhpD family alkylhydroperoxidase
MQNRSDPFEAAPELTNALVQLEQKLRTGGLEPSLIRLVKTQASQLSGCAYCLHVHVTEARAAGETETRLHLLSAWPPAGQARVPHARLGRRGRGRGARRAAALPAGRRGGRQDLSALRQLLAEDVVVYSDGGGKRSAATKPVLGSSRVERFYIGLARKAGYQPARFYEPAQN